MGSVLIMSPSMPGQLGGGGEPPGTGGEVTHIRFFSGMINHMLLQSGRFVELFETNVAFDGCGGSVAPDMGVQGGLGVVGLVTVGQGAR